MPFQLQANYQPAGDQPKAINDIVSAFQEGKSKITLLGATGTGKTFTIANIIQHLQRPTLIISHNKTLAAQLSTEFKHFFPHNAVHYFVSYFDYYQPESYLPASWTYIEKEATINQEIEMYRLATMASLLSREDVIVVASASSLYGLGQARFFQENCLQLKVGQSYQFQEIKKQLLHIQYKPVHGKVEAGMFDLKGETLEIYSSTEKLVYKCFFDEDVLEQIEIRDSLTFELKRQASQILLRPATQYLQNIEDLELVLQQMNAEKELRVKEFEKANMLVEAERIKKRVEYDIRMIKETWFVNGIENYSLYFDKRLPGEAPNTIFDYFPDDFLLIIDESHMTIPQLNAMAQGDRARKNNLIKYGFRLPSAIDHRPLRFEELEVTVNWKDASEIQLDQASVDGSPLLKGSRQENQLANLRSKQKKQAKSIFLSATPASFEIDLSEEVVEQIIRPTGLLDPITYVYPKSWNYNQLLSSVEKLLKKKVYLSEFFHEAPAKEDEKAVLKEVFGEE